LLVVDSDHRLPKNIHVLYDILSKKEHLGGVSGLQIEGNKLAGSCCDLKVENNDVIKYVEEKKKPEVVEGHTIFEFDQIPNITLFKKECLENYCWDPHYKIGYEHVDFYLTHLDSDWKFAVCPNVIFKHDPGGSSEYNSFRTDKERLNESKRYFMDKWGYDNILWNDVFPPTYDHTPVNMYQNIFKYLPEFVYEKAFRIAKYIQIR
jgi:hypothetical protein